MSDHSAPQTPLAEVQAMVLGGSWTIRREAQLDALALVPQISVRSCLLALTEGDFHKAMNAEEPKWKGAIQDVYRTQFGGLELYVKFQIWPLDKRNIYVVSFKEK